MKKKLISLMLVLCLAVPVASCNKEDDGVNQPENERGGYTAGNPDYEDTYYSSKVISIPQQSYFVHGFAAGDKACFILERSEYDDSTNSQTMIYSLFVYDYDGNKISECSLDDSDHFYICDACALDDDCFVVAGTSLDYRIYDLDGHVIKEADSYSGSECNPSVCKTSDGFMVCVGSKVVRYDSDANVTDEIDLDSEPGGYSRYGISGVFEQNGQCYGYGIKMLDDNSGLECYYQFLFDTGEIETLSGPSGVAGVCPDMEIWNNDYHRNTCLDESGSEYIVEIDVAGQRAYPLASKNNMLICPPTYPDDQFYSIKVLDKNHFYAPYTFIGKDIELTEIMLIVPDDTLNLDDRTVLTIQGAGISSDTVIKNAAYYFNVSQNEYMISLDELASRYSFSSPENMNVTRLQLMAQYNNGNVPDMFYGDFFDYNYMGENDMVMDLSPYLGDDPILDRMRRNDGKIYQIYGGYSINGYFGLCDVYGSEVDISSMPSIPDGQDRFGNAYSPDIVYNALGRDLCCIYRRGDLTPENVLSVVRCAIGQGYEPDYQYSNYQPPEASDVRNGRSSLYNTNLSSPMTFVNLAREFGGDVEYVGYPSIGGSIHSIAPYCLMAVSEASQHKDVCVRFISTLLSLDVQRKICGSGSIPVNSDVLNEMIEVLKDPDSATQEQKILYSGLFVRDYSGTVDPDVMPLTEAMADSYLDIISKADSVSVYDWGLWVITRDEVSAYYTQGKSIEDVADALYSRYLIYAQENYG